MCFDHSEPWKVLLSALKGVIAAILLTSAPLSSLYHSVALNASNMVRNQFQAFIFNHQIKVHFVFKLCPLKTAFSQVSIVLLNWETTVRNRVLQRPLWAGEGWCGVGALLTATSDQTSGRHQ